MKEFDFNKLKKCDQNWDSMRSTSGGRTCGKCSNTVVDFSCLSISEIKDFQNRDAHCGFYTEKQLKILLKQERKKSRTNKFLITLSTIISTSYFFTPDVKSQVNMEQNETKQVNRKDTLFPKSVPSPWVIKGSVFTTQNEPLIGTAITIRDINNGGETDIDGKFEIDLSDLKPDIQSVKLTFHFNGYFEKEVEYTRNENFSPKIILKEDKESTTYFYVVEKNSKKAN